MKILMVGSDAEWALERWYAGHLRQEGIDTRLFPAQTLFYDYYRRSLLHKVIYKLGLSPIYKQIARALTGEVRSFSPDVVWVFKGMEIEPSFLSRLKQSGIRTVNFNADNPFIFSGPGSGNKNVTRSIGLYDLHLSYDRAIMERIEREYGIPCCLLPFGYELADDLFEKCLLQQEERCICFIGNPDRDRASFLMDIAEHLPIHVYGHGWEDFVKHSRISVFGAVYGAEFWKTLHRYRVQLNLMRVHNPQSHNMRSFEIPGAGAIGLFPDTPDHRTYFEDGKEVFLYRNLEECVELAGKILEMPVELALRVRRQARQRSVTSGYSYRNRLRTILPCVIHRHA